MSSRRARAALVALVLLALAAPRDARADLPPPPGQTRVSYSFRASGSLHDVVLVAFPMYRSGGGHVVEVELDKDLVPVQGWTPGIYSIGAGDSASLKGNEDDAAIRAVLDSKAHLCVKKVPRVFNVPSTTKVSSITDVFGVDATPAACKATLAKTLYAGANGEKGEGGIDASGHRLPPPPFGRDLPAVEDLGPAPATPTSTPAPAPALPPASSADPARPSESSRPHSGCTGCALPRSREDRGAAAFWLLGLALFRARIRRRV